MFRMALAFVLVATGVSLCAQEPSLLLSLKDFQARKELAQRETWASANWANLIREANDFPKSYEERFGLTAIELPPEGGQWLHWYVCPDTGRELQFRPPSHNVCPDSGKEYSGWPYDQAVYQLRNDALHRAALTLGLAYRFTGDKKYAAEVASLLKAYADRYSSWKLHDNNGKESPNGAKAYSQTLDESIWLIDLAWSYDLVRGSGELSNAEKEHIERDLLRASYQTVSKAHKGPTMNIQSWINCAIAAVGYTLHDADLIKEAIDGPIGFRHQMKSFVNEGFWEEGAWGYQFYAMRPLTLTAEMAKHAGTDLWREEPALLSLFHAPLGVLFFDGTLPAFNDSKTVNLYDQDFLYEHAYAASHDPELLRVIEHNGRTNRDALLFGDESLPLAPRTPVKSRVFPEAGFATLRNAENDLSIVTKFGPHGGPHGHYDKLNFVLYSQGRAIGFDPGAQPYGLPIHREWDAMTIAHNTITVDETRQADTRGKLLDWQSGPGWTAIMMDAGPAYQDISMQRTILLTPEYGLVMDRVSSSDGKEHIFDWAYHNLGELTESTPKATQPFQSFPKKNGYDHLNSVMQVKTDADMHLRFMATGDGRLHDALSTNSPAPTVRVKEQKTTDRSPVLKAEATMRLTVLGAPATELFTGKSPGIDLRVPDPFVIVRRSGAKAEFDAVLSPDVITCEHRPGGGIILRSAHFVDTVQIGEKLQYQRKIIGKQ